MIRTIIIALAVVLALTGVALAWTGSRDFDPGDPIQLPDARQEDAGLGLDPDDDGSGDPDDGFDNDDPDTSYSNDTSDDSSTSFSDTSYSSDSSIFKSAPKPISVIKPSAGGKAGDRPATPAKTQYRDDSASLYSYDSFSIDSVSSWSR